MSVMVIRTLLHPGTILYFLALLDVRLWCSVDDPSPRASYRCRRHSLAVVAMAAEDDTVVPSNVHQSMNSVAQQSTEDDDTQTDPQLTDPNNLEQKDGDTELSKSIQGIEEETTITSHEKEEDIMEHISARTSHTPTPCKSSNYMRDVIVQATKSSFIKPTCSVEPKLEHVDPGIEPVDLQNVTEPTNGTSTSELGEDDRVAVGKDDHGELSGMGDGVPGTEEGTAQPVKEKEEAAQDEDILTFEEFKQRRMMEVQLHQQEEIKISEPTGNGGAVRGNNYASLECGAKVIATNEEASNPKAILQENRDVYMLSPCSADIWFIVELCDMVLVHSIEIATFELFSSVPEVFAVYTSSRYPATEWSLIGQFNARIDSRTVQTFPLGESVYAKYIKVEMISHFGSEHYCPLSLLRVLGTSFIQEYEDSEERNGAGDAAAAATPAAVIMDGTDNAPINSEESQEASNRSSILVAAVAAKDALVNILEKVSNGLMGAAGDSASSNNTTTHTLSLTTGSTGTTGSIQSLPTDLVPAGEEGQEGNSTDDLIQDTPIAASSDIIPTSSSSTTSTDAVSSVTDSVIATSSSDPSSSVTNTLIANKPVTTATAADTTANTIADISDTTSTDNLTQSTSIIQQHSTNDNTVVDIDSPALDNSSDGSRDASSIKTDNTSAVNATGEGSGDPEMSTTSSSNSSDNITTLTSHVNNTDNEDYDNGEEETFTDSLPTHQPPLPGSTAAGQQQQKSSVLIRLSNRIKELEVNMSLFGDYLDRVRTSLQRNKNRTDDLQRCIERRLELLNETVTALRNETEMGWVLLLQLHEDIKVLTKTADDISQSLKLIQGGSVSWYHLIYEAILVVMVITVYHTYYRSQWEAHMTTMMSKMMIEIERSSRRSNHVYKNQDYHDDIADHPYTRDAVETHRRRKKTTGGKVRQAN